MVNFARLKMRFLRLLDKFIGRAIIMILSLRNKHSNDKLRSFKVRRVLLIKLFGFGNLVLLTPLIQELKKRFQVDYLCFSQAAKAFELYPDLVDNVLTIRMNKLPLDIYRIIKHKAGYYDLIIDLEQFVRLSAIIGLLLKPKLFFGMPTPSSGKRRAFDNYLFWQENKHTVEEYYEKVSKLLRAINVSLPTKSPVLKKPRIDEQPAYNFKDVNYISICVGGSAHKVETRYPLKHWVELTLSILKSCDFPVIFVGGSGDSKIVEKLRHALPKHFRHRIINLCGRTSLKQSASIIAKSKLLISTDTGPLHIGAALGIHVVGIFGGTTPNLYGPYTKNKKVFFVHKGKTLSNMNEKIINPKIIEWPSPELISSYVKKKLGCN
ncbi:glycosyltransferase family 9 protein [Candidatus Woesearchaeota archaeon]|nr:glycosyltransferase family 9 protein [Candidatus Woesearchaeota archaeon]